MNRVSGVLIVVLMAFGQVATPVAAADGPYDLNSGRETSILAASGGFFGLGLAVDCSAIPLTPAEIDQLDPSRLSGFDRTAIDNWSPGAARASDYLLTANTLAPTLLMTSQAGRDQANVIAVMYAETYLLNSGLTYLLKNAFGRTRPYLYNDDPAISLSQKTARTSRRSFPSGHTSTAFSSLVFLASVQTGLNPGSAANDWIWGGCIAAAATTGYLRYAAGMHFPTDILAGAALGAFAGWLVPELHEWDEPTNSDPAKSSAARETVIGFSIGF